MYIFFYNNDPIEWGIKQIGYSKSDYDKKANKEFGFATLCIKNGKFMYAYDLHLDEKCFNKTQELSIFDEICEFECEIGESKIVKIMSIKEAFKIIYDNFKD
ncbi:hypothetical protein CSPARA_0936 [Campylobacter sputorum bv. paraureolyticus LMG 11764]|nr:hypothetical protein CSPARA_0936 [Campylobacter sputorum bv. paraureolyticus LMG 11764]